MAQSWPGTLPNWLFEIEDNPSDVYIRSQTDVGPGKVRKRYTGQGRNVGSGLVVTGAQRIILENLYYNSPVFEKEDPRDDTVQVFRFEQAPSFTLRKPHEDADKRLWNVSLTLKKLP